MVAAVHFFATDEDEKSLLDYVLASDSVRLFPWATMDINDPTLLDRKEQLPTQSEGQQRYGIVDHSLGSICFHSDRPTWIEGVQARTYVFDRTNWDNASPADGHGIVDWNRTPALFWERGTVTANGALGVCNIGSQADAMDDISADYRKWVNRVMNWVKHKGTKVAQNAELTSESQGLSLKIEIMNSVFALPYAMEFFRGGGSNRRLVTKR